MGQFSLFLFILWVLIIIIIMKFFVGCQHLIFHFTDLIISVTCYGPAYFYRPPYPPLYQNAYMQICLLVVYYVLGTWALLYFAFFPGGNVCFRLIRFYSFTHQTWADGKHNRVFPCAGKGCYTGLNNLVLSSEHHHHLWKPGQGIKEQRVSRRPSELRGFLLSSLL